LTKQVTPKTPPLFASATWDSLLIPLNKSVKRLAALAVASLLYVAQKGAEE